MAESRAGVGEKLQMRACALSLVTPLIISHSAPGDRYSSTD